MLLSIVIPMYNAEPYIGECLDSILQQGLAPNSYEIVIINDGSTDNSSNIVQNYMDKHPLIRLLNQANSGQSAARNYGVSKATGDYVQFVDADDFLIPNSLSKVADFVVKGLNQNESPLSFDMITFNLSGGNVDNKIITVGGGNCNWQGNGYEYIATHNYNNSPCYYWINRTFIIRKGLLFEEGKLCEDGIFTLTALLNSKSIAHIDSTVYFYAVRPNSTTTTFSYERRQKLVEGFVYAIGYFDKMIENHKDFMDNACLERIVARRDSYVFFLLIRLLRMGSYDEAKNVIGLLRKKEIYPIKHFIGKDYNGSRFRIITAFMNNSHLYLALCKINCVRLKVCSLFSFVRH